MRVAVLLAAVVALWVQPASAAVTLNLQVDGVIPTTDMRDYGTDFSDPGCVNVGGHCQITMFMNLPFDHLVQATSQNGILFNFGPVPEYVGRVLGSTNYLGAGIFQPLLLQYDAVQFGTQGYATRVGSGQTGSFSVFDPLNPPVPEPSTWALMLVGFGAIGFGMRRRPYVSARTSLMS